jgi:hypothetical protein
LLIKRVCSRMKKRSVRSLARVGLIEDGINAIMEITDFLDGNDTLDHSGDGPKVGLWSDFVSA